MEAKIMKHLSQFQNGLKASHRRKPMSRKELKIIDSATLYCVSGFRRNYNNGLLKLAHPSVFQKLILLLLAFFILLMLKFPVLAGESDLSGILHPVQITFETVPIQFMAVSRDGKRLVCAMEKNGFTNLWLYSADPQKIIFPVQITDDPFIESSPVFSPDGRFIAFTGTNDDVKGDIYLLNIEKAGSLPEKLTGRETRDGGACFDPTGKILYFHQTLPGEVLPKIVSLRLDGKHLIHRIETGSDGSDPDLSPDGQKICYTSYQSDPTGSIMIYDLKTLERKAVTAGTSYDSSPKWSTDGKTVFFTRIFMDTDQDEKISYRDNAVLFRVNPNLPDPEPFPLTRFDRTARNPMTADGKLFLISPQNRNIDNCFFFLEQGLIPLRQNVNQQDAFCRNLADKISVNPFLKILAHSKIMEFGQVKEAGSAAYRIGRILEEMGLLQGAIVYYESVSENYRSFEPDATLSRIALTAAHTQLRLRKTAHADEKTQIIQSAVEELKSISNQGTGLTKARADIEVARLLAKSDSGADSLFESIRILDRVIHSFPDQDYDIAEATLLKAQIYTELGRSEEVFALYKSIIRNFPDQTRWVVLAIEKSLDFFLQSKEGVSFEEKINSLKDLSEKNHEQIPMLSAGALNRAADLYVQNDQWTQAKELYRLVLERYPSLTFQAAASRLALAEILYREERFREALNLYETEINQPSGEENIVELARRGYIRKSIASGEYLFRLGEVPAAMSRFRELIDYDQGIVEAHRGYIKCVAAQNMVDNTLNTYRTYSLKNPKNPIYIYGTALLLTYQDNRESLSEAKILLEKAIHLNGQIEYFHQTLGYVFEMFETVYGEKGNLESALESYKKAYFLNDYQRNPENRSHLALNIANIHFHLGQFHQALQYYTMRLDAKTPFDNPDTEILFYQRLGVSAFQAKENQKTITAFRQSIKLIRETSDPYEPVRMFENIHRFIMDEIIMPASSQNDLKQDAEVASAMQSDINRTLTKISENLFPPPSSEWNQFENQMEDLISQQEKILPDMYSLVEKLQNTELTRMEAEQRAEWFLIRVRKALQQPSRIVMLETEMRDRLGLALQENGNYQEAAEQFETAFSLNQKLGQNQNLSVNRRSVAYNQYMQASLLHGEEKKQLLKEAARNFKAAEKLLDQYGVSTQKQKEKGLLDLSLEVALDKKGATQASHGFSLIQEKRLISTFLIRIGIELGDLVPAEKEIQKQLAEYPLAQKIEDKDLYGVSLLYHRAGLLSAARKQYKEAFSHFEHSAQLSYQYGNPISTCINVMNMAHTLSGFTKHEADIGFGFPRLLKMEKQAGSLLQASNIFDPVFAAGYYNTIGQYLLTIEGQSSEVVDSSVNRFLRIQKAILFLNQGIKLFDENEHIKNREDSALLASLHLNKAIAASLIGEKSHSLNHFQAAFRIAEKNLLPDLEWRALVGLGKLKEALDVLSDITISRAGCSPFEITDAFHPLVLNLIQSDQKEEALNFIEKISETERFNRMAFLFRDSLENGKRIFQRIYPRIERIKALRNSIRKNVPEELAYLKKQLSDETDLLEQNLGKENEKLPDLIRWIKDKELQENLILLLGVAEQAEYTAEQAVRAADSKKASVLRVEYNSLIEKYHKKRLEFVDGRPDDIFSDPITFLGPEPAEAADIMNVLSEDQMLVRLFRIEPDIYSFSITADQIDMQKYPSVEKSVNALPDTEKINIAYELPREIPGRRACSLSGTHFFRSIVNRKPFKNNVVTVPEALPDQEGYQMNQIGQVSHEEQNRHSILLSEMNTLLLSKEVSVSTTIPTRSGEKPDRFISFENQDGNPDSIEPLLTGSKNLSLALISESSPDDLFLIGNLFSIYHCPSVLFSQAKGNAFSKQFLENYRTKTVLGSIQGLKGQLSSTEPDPEIVLLGYQGMSSAESELFLQEYFVRSVQKGKAAFDEGRNGEAFSYFQNALEISQKFTKFHSLLPRLLSYCRETAYQEKDLEQSALYARKLVKLMEEENPDTENHAESLLRLGLILAAQEKFGEAIPLLDESVEMLENLELDEKKILAMSELGILLENATEYDRALTTFQSAAEISNNLGKDSLLADQYMNMGRIYDLRLSQYASAIKNYQKALLIYQDMEDVQKTAQVFLDIGRCYRLLGNFPKAEESFQTAFAMIDSKDNMQLLAAKILIEQANNAWFQARYEKAFLLQRKAFDISMKADFSFMKVICLNTSGLIWWTLGDHQKALFELEKALEIANSNPNRKDEIASTLNNIGLVLRETGRYPEAIDTFDRALLIDEKLQSKWAIAYDFRNKALTLFKMGRVEDSIPLFEMAARKSNEIGNKINEAKSLLGLADAFRSANRIREARKAYEQALSLASGMNLLETKWRAVYGLAQLNLLADPITAEKQLRDAIDVIEVMRADIKIEQLKESFSDNKFMVYETLVRLLADRGKIEESFEIAERSRSRSFIDLLGNRPLTLNHEEDQHLYDKQKQVRARLDEIKSLISQSTEAQEKKIYQKTFTELEHEYQNILLEMQSKNPQLASMVSVTPLKADHLMEYIDPGTALLSYYVLEDEIFCWLIQKKDDQTHTPSPMLLFRLPINKKKMGEDILEYRRVIQNLEPFETLSKALYSLLIEQPISRLNGIKNLGIIPHGPLHYLSFATLFNGKNYLIDDYSLFYLPSASVWKYTKERRQPKKNVNVLAIGNPDLGDPVLDLPFSEYEVGSIQWSFPNITVLTKETASEEWVAKNTGKFGIIHLASHGEFDPINPLFSAIKLSRSKQFDGNLEASEIFGLQINADMVVLSACQSGLGKVTGGDDVIGLNRAFFYAGTHTVVSSLWRVSDVSTALLIKTFYRRYTTYNKADSLRYSALHVRNRYPHPGYWGAFTLVGDYE
ncbi:MAG: hypothetical protein C0403_00135 [Desulfobacterium sp.]|nr:hypothetical protein [Desulfobacterium sp.]